MPILEAILSVLAPHDCLGCGREGSLVCADCNRSHFPVVPERCYKCHALGPGGKTCIKCRRTSKLGYVNVATLYDGLAKEILYKLKFERAYAGAKAIAELCADVFPEDFNGLLVPIPTASVRRRQRGYDQSELITHNLANLQGVQLKSVLSRRGNSRQVGTKRAERLDQLKDVFYVPYPHLVKGKNVLLVDDVLTTGATLEAAATVMRRAGAKTVSAIVFAQA